MSDVLKWFVERLLVCIGAYGTLATVLEDNFAIPIVVILSILYFGYEGREKWLNRPLIYSGDNANQKEKINKFMFDWINQGQKIAIFSNDMSWMHSASDVKDLLLQKAKLDDVELFLPKTNALSDELKKEGATVYPYDGNFQPKVRFTVINPGRDDARVAIGRSINKAGDFEIKKYSMGHDATCALAVDILDLIRKRMNARKSGQE